MSNDAFGEELAGVAGSSAGKKLTAIRLVVIFLFDYNAMII